MNWYMNSTWAFVPKSLSAGFPVSPQASLSGASTRNLFASPGMLREKTLAVDDPAT
jgi:hypothetical protein